MCLDSFSILSACTVQKHGRLSGTRRLATEAPLPEALIQPLVLHDALEYKGPTIGQGRLSKGAVACTLGHAMMWEHILQQERMLVTSCEDDQLDCSIQYL